MSKVIVEKQSPQVVAIMRHTMVSDRVEELSREALRGPYTLENRSLLTIAREREAEAWQEVEKLQI